MVVPRRRLHAVQEKGRSARTLVLRLDPAAIEVVTGRRRRMSIERRLVFAAVRPGPDLRGPVDVGDAVTYGHAKADQLNAHAGIRHTDVLGYALACRGEGKGRALG